MEELLSMGFPRELAAEALNATGGADVLKAADWILSRSPPSPPSTARCSSSSSPTIASSTPPNNQQLPSSSDLLLSNISTPPPPPPPPPPFNFQPKIDHFFTFRALKETKDVSIEQSQEEPHTPSSGTKRPRLRPEQELECPPPPPPTEPLSERMRPHILDQVVGQDQLLGPNSVLHLAIHCKRLPSILLWGPPGTGKTSIARAIVNSSCSAAYRFVSLSAVNSGVKDVRDAVEEARKWRAKAHKRTVLFIDEVHRFNKAQQDSFLPVIEDGSVVFMGATTENPSFHLITPLLSRCTVLVLNPLKPHHITALLKRAISDSDKGLSSSIFSGVHPRSGRGMIEVEEEAIEFLSAHCDGDARVALNGLEISATIAVARSQGSNVTLNLGDVKEALQCKHIAYDKAGEEHYNLISALHKSMRGSDADASIYWLARMLEGGEEPLYIARRLIRFASEDVGLADPSALTQAVACYQACHFIGMPECNVNLAQCVAYLALAPKSVSVYKAIVDAQKVVRESVGQNEGVPLHLRNAPTKLMSDLGYGKGYVYPPDNPSSVSQIYLPPSLQGYKFLHWPRTTEGD